MNKTLAGDIRVGDIRGPGNIGLEYDTGPHIELGPMLNILTSLISLTVGALTVIAFMWFIIKLLTGGIGIISAGGDKGKMAAARDDITYGAIGLVIVVTAVFIAGVVGTVLGLDILDVDTMIAQLAGRT